jgi:pyruvate ferredoxin oxidoreductase alpha subunit
MPGLAAGLVRVRSYRPFPMRSWREGWIVLRAVLIIDRDISFGMEGALYSDCQGGALRPQVRGASLYNARHRPGGRDVPYTVMAEEMRR